MHVHEPCSSLRERSPCVPHVRLRRPAAIHRCSYTQTQRPYSARTAPVLSASRRVAKTAQSGVLGNQTCCARTRTLLKLARAFSPCVPRIGLRRSAQLYTDAAIHRRSARTAPVLSASRRVAKTARSGVLGVHGHCVVSRTKPARVHVHEPCASLQ
jgi:hypothetical protein